MGASCDEVACRGQGITVEDSAGSEREPFPSLDVEESDAECQGSCKAHDESVPISCSTRGEGHDCCQAAGQQDECHREAVPDFEYCSWGRPCRSGGSHEEICADEGAKEYYFFPYKCPDSKLDVLNFAEW